MIKTDRILFLALLSIGWASGFGSTASAQATLIKSDFEHSSSIDNPWSCVDSTGHIKGTLGVQLAVTTSGALLKTPFSPTAATGDLNGDGLPDLVVADAQGFFWYFQNSGTKTVAKFTNAELMPIWLGDPVTNIWNPNAGTNNVVPHIQLIDFDHDGKLDLVVGTFTGSLFYIRNIGSTTAPMFKTPHDLKEDSVATSKGGILWCNYLAPFLFDWTHTGRLDLTMGEGTYSANSIYLFANKGSNDKPIFNEDGRTKLIPGMGREHLFPQIIDWNNDGKPDILTAEREGYINIFLNTSPSADTFPPTFDGGQHVLLGGKDKQAELTTVSLGDLNNSGLPSLILGSTNGYLSYAQNIGKIGQPQFAAAVPLLGTNDRPKILLNYGWHLTGGQGSPYDLLVCTNAKVEPGFTPPPDTTFTSALRFYIDEPAKPNPTFPDHFYPDEDTRFIVPFNDQVGLKPSVSYELSFWVRTTDDIKLSYHVRSIGEGSDYDSASRVDGDVDGSPTWSHFRTTFRVEATNNKKLSSPHQFRLSFKGRGSIYLDDIELVEKK